MPKILIIEDDQLISRMYEKAFSFEKFEVRVEHNGEAGLEAVSDMQPDLILLDVMMPKMTGIDVLKELKANPKNQSIPVIVLTNLSGTEDAEMALSLGAVKYIIKSQQKPRQIVAEVKEIIAAYTRDHVPESIGT